MDKVDRNMYLIYTRLVQDERENPSWNYRARQSTLSGINGEKKFLKKTLMSVEPDPAVLSGFQFKIVNDVTGQVVVWENFYGESFLT